MEQKEKGRNIPTDALAPEQDEDLEREQKIKWKEKRRDRQKE